MKQINNYIQEKLHINKNYKIEATDFKDFRKCLEKYGYFIDRNLDTESDEKSYEIFPCESEAGFPCIDITIEEEYFNDFHNTFDTGTLIVYETLPTTHEFDTDGFDVVENKGYAYTEKNARLIAEELNEYK